VHGWLIVDKPSGPTSAAVVAVAKRALGAAKAGHAGTLDPIATGILPIALGEATKTIPFLMEADKAYRFSIRWGISTATQDREGAVTAQSDARPAPDAIRAALPAFVGEIEQVPPAFSAIKVDGERAYDLARAGEEVELKSRPVTVFEASLLETTPDEAVFLLRCGKGFYVRAFARDLAAALGCEGHVSSLRRLAVGPFEEGRSVALDVLEDLGHKGAASERLEPVETALADIPALAVSGEDAFKLRQGRAIVLLPHIVEQLRAKFKPRKAAGQDASRAALALCEGRPVALGDVRAGQFQPTRVFHLS